MEACKSVSDEVKKEMCNVVFNLQKKSYEEIEHFVGDEEDEEENLTKSKQEEKS